MSPAESLLAVAVFGFVVYFFVMSGSDEMKPNDPDVAFDKNSPRVYGPSIAMRGYLRWVDIIQRIRPADRSGRAPKGEGGGPKRP